MSDKVSEPRRWMSNHPGPTRDMVEVVRASAYDAMKAENARLKALLDEAVEVIEFYASGASWTATEDTDLFIKITSKDWIKREGGWFCGGNTAEMFLAKLQEAQR